MIGILKKSKENFQKTTLATCVSDLNFKANKCVGMRACVRACVRVCMCACLCFYVSLFFYVSVCERNVQRKKVTLHETTRPFR